MSGIVSYGAYLPYWRLQRGAIGQSLGSGGGKGTRSVASFDEDSTSMGVESGRIALAAAPQDYAPARRRLRHHGAGVRRQDQRHGHPRRARPCPTTCRRSTPSAPSAPASAPSSMAQALGGLAVLSDVRTGRPGSADEAGGGDAAVTLAFGDEGVIAEVVGVGVGQRRVHRPLARPGRAVRADLGGALRRARLRAAGRAGRHGGAEGAPASPSTTSTTSSSPGSHARAVKAAAKAIGARPDGARRRPVDRDRQRRHGPLGAAAGRRPRPRRAGPADRRRAAGRRLRRVAPAHDRRAGRQPAGRVGARTASRPPATT